MTNEQVYAMDRVAKRLVGISNDWLAFNQRFEGYVTEACQIWREAVDAIESAEQRDKLKAMIDETEKALLEFVEESENRRCNFGNIASLGSPEGWRLLAEADKIILPFERDPARKAAETLIRESLNLPRLIEAVAQLIEGAKQ